MSTVAANRERMIVYIRLLVSMREHLRNPGLNGTPDEARDRPLRSCGVGRKRHACPWDHGDRVGGCVNLAKRRFSNARDWERNIRSLRTNREGKVVHTVVRPWGRRQACGSGRKQRE